MNGLRIAVCIKQVPDFFSVKEVKIDPETKTLVREGVPSIVNPLDRHAIEEAVKLKEAHGGEVTVITMGPPQAKEALLEALAMGCDKAVLLSDRRFAGADTLATAVVLAEAIRKLGGFDIILCGKQTLDGETAHVGPELAELLDLPQITYVKKLEVKEGKVVAERLLEEGYEVVEAPLPVLVTVVKEINTPRYPSLRGIMEASKKPMETWNMEYLGLSQDVVGLLGSPTQVTDLFYPERKRRGEVISGSASEVVEKIVEKLKEVGVL